MSTLLKTLPVSRSFLQRYRVQAQRRHQLSPMGQHLRQRQGHSLEYREHVEYTPGDDIRHVDWRASARFGDDKLLVRRFVAEESLSLVISLDARPSMRQPEDTAKLQVAAWIAEALARITLYGGDTVILHRLFDPQDGRAWRLSGQRDATHVYPRLCNLLEKESNSTEVNLKPLHDQLPPTAAWFILSDFYFDLDDQARLLAQRISTAQQGWRWIVLLDLNSWPYEKSKLPEGAYKILGPGVSTQGNDIQLQNMTLQEVEAKIYHHKETFKNMIPRAGYEYLTWEWPAHAFKPAEFFTQRFGQDNRLNRLFVRQA